MAFGVDAVSSGSAQILGGGAGNVTFAHTNAGNLLLVGVAVGASDANPATTLITGVTFNGDALTAVAGSESDDDNFVGVKWFKLDTPDIGTFNIVVSVPSSGTSPQVFAGAISFLDAGTLGTPSTATASTANPSVTAVDTQSADIVVSIVASDSGPVSTMTQAGSLIGEVENIGTDCDMNAQYQTASGPNTVCSWACSATEAWANSALAVRAAGGGAAALPLMGQASF